MPPPRMTANPVKPARYRPGKGPEEDHSSEEESDEGEEEGQELQTLPSKPAADSTKIASDLRKVNLSERRAQAAAAEASRLEAEKEARAKEEEEFETEDSSEGESGTENGDEEEEHSSEEESSSEDDLPKILIRPKFIRKNERQDSSAITDARAGEQKWVEEEARRKAKANELIQEQLERNAAARAAGKKNWDDDEEEEADAVDDADGMEPEAEYAAWKLRELKRVVREREAIEEAEKEREEIERRRNLGSEEREAEDAAFLAKQKEEQDGRGKMSYMQKYFHKGAFFQDNAKEQGLDRRDIMGSKFEDQTDRSLLPEYMQIRDMTKLGKKGRSKYRDMKSEDTGQWGVHDSRKLHGQRGLDERFEPDHDGGRTRDGPSGANAIHVRERRRDGSRKNGESERRSPNPGNLQRADQDAYGEQRRPRSSSRSRSRSRSSRTPSPRRRRRQEDGGERRKRSPSPYRDRNEDKRRRVDVR